jgi:putative FmdB family regulatory protein
MQGSFLIRGSRQSLAMTLFVTVHQTSYIRLERGELHMPIFEYVCTKCEHHFEALIYGSQKASCPKCKCKELAPQLSVFAVSAKGSSSSAQSAAPSGGCGSCGDPRGPGACSMPDFD